MNKREEALVLFCESRSDAEVVEALGSCDFITEEAMEELSTRKRESKRKKVAAQAAWDQWTASRR